MLLDPRVERVDGYNGNDGVEIVELFFQKPSVRGDDSLDDRPRGNDVVRNVFFGESYTDLLHELFAVNHDDGRSLGLGKNRYIDRKTTELFGFTHPRRKNG
jgi:hypothetical protein